MKISLKNSGILNGGAAIPPTADHMEFGEVAINYSATDPAIFIKDSDGVIQRVSGKGNISFDNYQAIIPISSTSPSSVASGNLYWDQDDERLYIYNGSTWKDASKLPFDASTIPDLTNAADQSGTFDDRYFRYTGGTLTGTLTTSSGFFVNAAYIHLNNSYLAYQGASNGQGGFFKTTVNAVNATANNTINFPNRSGTVITTGDSGTITASMLGSGSITDAQISSSAAISPSKIATGTLPSGIKVNSENIINGSIKDVDINSSAAIALTKLGTGNLPSGIQVTTNNLTAGIPASDISAGTLGSGVIVSSNNYQAGSINNAAISSTAEIAVSKLADGSARQLLQTNDFGNNVEWASDIDIPGTLDVTGNAVFDGRVTISDVFTVNSSEITLNAPIVNITDKNITLNSVASPTDANADGGGISVSGSTTKTFSYDVSNSSFTSSEHLNLVNGKGYEINGASVLTHTTLGSGVVNSSLESVGTIQTGTWEGSVIDDIYISTIDTAGKVANSATTATSANTPNSIVSRDGSGDFTARIVNAALNGNASTATALETARTITLGGVLNGSVSFDGTSDVTINAGILSSVTDTNLSWTPATMTIGSSTGEDVNLSLFTSTAPGLTPYSGGGVINFLRADGTWAKPATDPTDLTWTSGTSTIGSSTGSGVAIPAFDSYNKGLVPSSGGGTTKFLRADGTWVTIGTGTQGSDLAYVTGTRTVTNTNGDGFVIPEATTSDPGLLSSSDKTQLTNLNTNLAGKADLDNGKLDTSQLPDLAVTEYLGSVANETAMLALTGEKGDWAAREDDGKIYIITGSDPSVASGWVALSYPVGETPAEILTALKTVDGAGSGLDADLLDGIQGSSFLRSDADDAASGQIKINDGSPNPLELERSSQVGIEFNDTSVGSRYLGVNSGNLYYGSDLNHGSNSKVWHAGNDGSGSGLDADLLDGLHESSFLRSDADDSFTGTLTGQYIHIDGSGPNWIRFLDQGSTTSGIDLIFRTTANTLGFERSTDGTHLWQTDCDTGVTDFDFNPTVSGNTIWHAGNDGSGSGLDADTLDGIQGSNFLRSNANDTATGNLTLSGQVTASAGISTGGADVYSSNGAFIANDEGGAFAARTGSNIDHIWHDDGNNRWNFCSDTTYKGTGNSKLQCGEVHATGSGSVGGTWTVASEINMMGSADADKFLDVRIGANTFHIRRTTGGDAGHESLFEADGNGGCRLYYDNAVKLETTNLGATLTGRLTSAGLTTTANLTISNDADLRVGDGTAGERILIQKLDNNVSDHIIFYNGTTRIGEIGCEDTTWLRINQETATNIYTPRYIRADAGFFVDGTTKGINGSGNFIGGTIAGASDYGTLIRSDADDNVTAHTEWQDSKQARFGASADLRIQHTGDENYIDSYNGHIYIRANAGSDLGDNIYIQARSGEHSIICNDDSSVVLYADNVAALKTQYEALTGQSDVHIYNDLVPDTDNSGQVGTSSYTWSDGRFTNMTIDSTLSVRSALDLADGDVLRMGSSDDFTVTYNSNGWNYINMLESGIIFQDNGTNVMRLEDSGVFRPEATNTRDLGTSSYYWQNAYIQNVYSSNLVNVRNVVDLADNDIIRFGSGDDVEFFCNGSHMYTDLNSGIGNWYIRDTTTTRYTFDDNGSFTATGNVTAYSDIRLKENIEIIADAVSKVQSLRGVTFDRNDNPEIGRQTGVIAQEVLKVLPEAVSSDKYDKDGILTVNYGAMVGLLIEAIKEQQQQIKELRENK